MLISEIVRGINSKLAGERCSLEKLTPHINSVIDDINDKIHARFPTFSELPLGTTEYSCFPDKYIRSVLFFGAAYYFYQTDEEGIDSAAAYAGKYQQGLFLMLRDYAMLVPEQYAAPDDVGSVRFELTGAFSSKTSKPGIDLSRMRI